MSALVQNATATTQTTIVGGLGTSDVISLVLTVVTAAMAIGTFWVARETRRMAKEQLETRLAEYEPIIKASLAWIGPIGVSLRIQNVGKGVAKDVEIEVKESPTDSGPRKSVQPLLAPGASASLILKPVYFKELSDRFDRITITGKCKDALGRDHMIVDTIDLKDIRKSIETAPQLFENTIDERVGKIADNLGLLDTHIQELVRLVETGAADDTAVHAHRQHTKQLQRLMKLQKRREKSRR